MDYPQIKSTAEGMRRFLEGTIWKDMLNEMEVWDQQLLRRYDSCDSIETLRQLQGAREAISYCMQLPERLLEGIEQEQEGENKTSDKI